MNYRYTGLLLVGMAGAAFGQQAVHTSTLQRADRSTEGARSTIAASRSGSDRSTVFSEDFANGLAGNNGFGAWTLTEANGNIWKYTHHGPNGAFSNPTAEIIGSTTASNGFMLFASDSANTNWPAMTIVTNPVAWDGALVSPHLDLHLTPHAVLTFQQRMRYCCAQTPPQFVQVSTDDGLTWPTSIPVITVAANTDPGTLTTTVNITNGIMANPANVRIRFFHDGTTSTATHYYWQIDDINISTQAPIDATIENAFLSETGTGEEYGRIPISQLPANMNVGADLINNGVDTLTNPKIVMKVRNTANTVVFSDSMTIATLASGDTMHMNKIDALSALPVGTYTATFVASSDENASDANLTDNTHLRTFEVTNTEYSLDEIGGHPAGYEVLTSLGTASFTNAADGLIGFTYYPVLTPMTVTGIEFVLTSGSHSGGTVTVSLRDTANVIPPGNDVSTTIATADHTISAYDVGNRVVGVAFNPPVVLQPGHYFAGVEMFSNVNAHDFSILDDITVPQPTWGSAIFDPGATPNARTFSNGNALAIRLTSNPNVGVTEHYDLQGVGMYPNPSTGSVTLFSNTTQNYVVEVINVMGEIVVTSHFNGTTNMDLSTLAKGLYSVRVSDSKASMVQRLVLN